MLKLHFWRFGEPPFAMSLSEIKMDWKPEVNELRAAQRFTIAIRNWVCVLHFRPVQIEAQPPVRVLCHWNRCQGTTRKMSFFYFLVGTVYPTISLL